MRRFVAFSLACLFVASFALVSTAQATDHSPPDEMMVVTTNLQEAWQDEANDNSEMDKYVARLLAQLPHLPDVLLLQEVKLKSARYVKDLLTTTTGDTYGWGHKPPAQPWIQNLKRRWEMDNAILFNTETTRKVGKSDWIDLTYKRAHAADKVERVETTRHGTVSLTERDGDMTLASITVHLQYGHLEPRYDPKYQVTWTDRLAQALDNRYPGAVHAIGGDFNEDRCVGESGVSNCDEAPFWHNLTTAPWNYEDSVYRVFRNGKDGVGLGGVDFIFTTGRPIDAGSDKSYDRHNPATFYSDHRFYWAEIGI